MKRKPAKIADLPDIIAGNATNEQLVGLLEEKIKMGMITAGQLANDIDSGVSEEEMALDVKEMVAAQSAGATGEGIEKASNYPPIYSNLITRTTGALSSTSPAAQAGKRMK